MAQMKRRNVQLKAALGAMAPKEVVEEVANIPVENTTTREGAPAYASPDELKLLTMLNTCKLEPQYYRSEDQTMRELRDLIERLALKDPLFVAKAICWSRNQGEGMRSINHLAAALLAPFAAGQEWAKRFYGPYNKKTKSGGCIFRPDDMVEIKEVFSALNKPVLTNAMRKGFADVLTSMSLYHLGKYRKVAIDIANLVHPNPNESDAVIEIEGKKVKALDAIMKGITVSADTWEVAQAEAGQEVAKAIKEGKLSESEAQEVLKEAKNKNWQELLDEGKLGILAAVRNIRNMLKGASKGVIDKLCELVENGELIRKGRVMPYQLDYAYEVTKQEFGAQSSGRQVMVSLYKGYQAAIPNLKELLPGKTVVFVDVSGSMTTNCKASGTSNSIQTNCAQKAGLIAATIAKATNADIVKFHGSAWFHPYNPNEDVFTLGRAIGESNGGSTSIPAAFELIRSKHAKYDRIIILSDYMCNARSAYGDWVSGAYKKYVHDVCSPYVYAVDLAGYGTVPVSGDKVSFYFGYGYSMFEDIASKEFNPSRVIDRVREYVI